MAMGNSVSPKKLLEHASTPLQDLGRPNTGIPEESGGRSIRDWIYHLVLIPHLPQLANVS